MRKTYWIACNAEAEVQTLALDRGRFPSHLAIRPRDLARLLSNFQISLQELTVIATEPAAGLPDAGGDVGGKAVELRSYNDPTKGCFVWWELPLWFSFPLLLVVDVGVLAGDQVVNCDGYFGLQMTATRGYTRNYGSTLQKSSWSMYILVIRWMSPLG